VDISMPYFSATWKSQACRLYIGFWRYNNLTPTFKKRICFLTSTFTVVIFRYSPTFLLCGKGHTCLTSWFIIIGCLVPVDVFLCFILRLHIRRLQRQGSLGKLFFRYFQKCVSTYTLKGFCVTRKGFICRCVFSNQLCRQKYLCMSDISTINITTSLLNYLLEVLNLENK
jgi:hypothetical protein